jgi:hypothetical protein
MWSKVSLLGYRRSLPCNVSLGTIVGQRWDGSGYCIDVWCLPSASHVPCIDQSHNVIRTWQCLLPNFLKVLSIYIGFWAGEFINTGCSEWWGFCVISWQFLQWIIYSISDFHPAMPRQFCNLHYISFIYWELHMTCLKIFPIFFRYSCEMFGVVLLVNFIMHTIYALLIAVVVVSCLCLSELLSGNLYIWLN